MEIDERRIVVSGEDITDVVQPQTKRAKKVVIGPGIKRIDESFIASKCGVLKFRENPHIVWVDYHQKRYIPVRGERILGIVVQKGSNYVKVDIGTNETAVLSLLAFEGATKRNKPHIQVGDVVFAQILSINLSAEIELVCVTSKGKRNGMGVLSGDGFLITVPINVCRRILSPECNLLKNLGTKFKFEIAVGINGRVWVRSVSYESTIFICNTISEIEYLSEEELKQRIDAILNDFEVYNKK